MGSACNLLGHVICFPTSVRVRSTQIYYGTRLAMIRKALNWNEENLLFYFFRKWSDVGNVCTKGNSDRIGEEIA